MWGINKIEFVWEIDKEVVEFDKFAKENWVDTTTIYWEKWDELRILVDGEVHSYKKADIQNLKRRILETLS